MKYRICQKSLRVITHTHLRMHGPTLAEYRDAYPGVYWHGPSFPEKQAQDRSSTVGVG
jgi:hypothetical protein